MAILASGRLRETPSKILCIGRNYARHADEMGASLPSEPVVFLKPPSALAGPGETVLLPAESEDVHHEVELVAVLGSGGKDIAVENALDHVAGYAVGLDLTARDLQARAKKNGLPWSVAKGFDTFAPLGRIVEANEVPDPQSIKLQLHVNGRLVQEGVTADMIFSVARLVSYCSTIFTLVAGDLLYTGTPEGVGPVVDGDELVASATGLPPLAVTAKRFK